MDAKPYREIEHTADLSLYVVGSDLGQLFCHAAQGMFSLMQPEPRGETHRLVRALKLDAPDQETLLVDWLSELLHIAETEQAHLDTFELVEITPDHLEALFWGDAPSLPQRSIKAVTFHDLAIERLSPAGYQVTITFDV